MKPVSPIDERMWRLAEEGKPEEIAEFKADHPDLAQELDKRVGMVAGLKGSRPEPIKRPKFMPSQKVVAESGTPAWLLWSVAGVFLSSIAFAGWGGVRYMAARDQAEQARQAQATATPVQQPTTNEPERTVDPAEPVPPPEQPVIPQMVKPFDRPVSIMSSQTTLKAALRDVADQAGISLDVAPGLEDMDITANYNQVKAQVVLEDLGRTCGFTVLIQTETLALLIPARESGGQNAPLPLPNSAGSSLMNPPANDNADELITIR